MKPYFILLILLCTSCVVSRQSESVKATPAKASYLSDRQIKTGIHKALLSDTPNATCNLDFLLPLLAKTMTALSGVAVANDRIDFIKYDLVKSYNAYLKARAAGQVAVITEAELYNRLSGYLDHMLVPANEKVPFWKFWKDTNSL